MFVFRRISVSLLLIAGLAFMCFAFVSLAEGQGKKGPGTKKGPINWKETKVAFDMRGKPWDSTIKWFCQQVEMPLAGKYPPPTGTITFYNVNGPSGKPREYSLVEVFDLLNEMLMAEYKHVLLRRETTLMIFPADVNEIPDHLIPPIPVKDLEEHGKTEIVEVTLTLKGSLNAEEFAPQAKRLLGDFAKVTPIEATNQLIIRAPVGSILRNLTNLTGRDVAGKPAVSGTPGAEEPSARNWSHKCVYLRASTAEDLLRKSLGNLTQVIDTKSANPMDKDKEKEKDFGKGGGTTRKVRVTTIASDKGTNTVFVSGPPDKIEQAKEVLLKADVPQKKGQKGILIGPYTFSIHEVPLGNADVMAKMIGDIFKDDSIRIQVNPPSRLLVYADPQTHLEINMLLTATPAPAQEMALVRLNRLDAYRFAETLKSMFPDSVNRSPFIEADTDNNSIRLRGTTAQVKAAKEVITAYDGAGVGAGSIMINLDKGSAVTVAEALEQLFPSIRDNPLKVITPGNGLGDKKDAKEPKKTDGPPSVEPVPVPKKSSQNSSTRVTPDMVRQAMHELPARYSPVSSVSQEKIAEIQPKKEPNKKKPTVIITAFGNRILISSDDPEALDVLQQMIRILVNTEAGPGDFVVLRLHNADAVTVAKILDEAFNGKAGGGGGGGGGNRGPGGGGGLNIPNILGSVLGGGGGGAPAGRVENIRVVADAGTNSLLVRAKPVDLMTIRRLLANSLDVDRREADNFATRKDFVIGPLKNAKAPEVAEIIERIYNDSLNSRNQSTQAVGAPGGGFIFNQQRSVDPATGGTAILAVAVDNTTNSVVVRCPTTLFKGIEKLVLDLDKQSADNKPVVRILPVNDIDPYVLAAAIDAISGKQVTSAQQRGNFGSTMGPGAFAPGALGSSQGGGGGNPGGGNFGNFRKPGRR